MATTLVGTDRASKAVLAHVVPQKGTQFDWVATRLEQDVRRFGYNGRLVVRSDGEPSIKDLMKELATKRREAPTVVETSKPYDSKSNGRAENAVKRIEGQVRTIKLYLEQAIGRELEVDHPVFEWLVEHCADILTKQTVGPDGRTPYERIKNKAYNGVMHEFGSMVWAKLPGKVQGGLMQERWVRAVWLGKKWSSEEHTVGVEGGASGPSPRRTARAGRPRLRRTLFGWCPRLPEQPQCRRRRASCQRCAASSGAEA